MKVCSVCRSEKPVSEFPRRGNGHYARCKHCHNARQREWRARTGKSYSKTRPTWSARLKHKFGITADEYDAMLVAQNGVCAICRTRPEGRNLAVDHDHKTGKVRGLLCNPCNAALGGFKDSAAVVRAGADYLEQRSFR